MKLKIRPHNVYHIYPLFTNNKVERIILFKSISEYNVFFKLLECMYFRHKLTHTHIHIDRHILTFFLSTTNLRLLIYFEGGTGRDLKYHSLKIKTVNSAYNG